MTPSSRRAAGLRMRPVVIASHLAANLATTTTFRTVYTRLNSYHNLFLLLQLPNSMATELNITINYRGTAHPLSVLPDATLTYLQARLEELTSVPPENQKLLFKGKKSVSGDATVTQAGLKDGMKVQLIGPTADELGGLKATESEHQRKERILQERAQRGPVKVRLSSNASFSP